MTIGKRPLLHSLKQVLELFQKLGAYSPQFTAMRCGKFVEKLHAAFGEGNIDVPAITRVLLSHHEILYRETINQTDRAVVPHLQPFGQIADRHVRPLAEPFDRKQCLMLPRRDADGCGRVLTESKELPECVSKGRERLIFCFGNSPAHHSTIADVSSIMMLFR